MKEGGKKGKCWKCAVKKKSEFLEFLFFFKNENKKTQGRRKRKKESADNVQWGK